MKFEIFSIFRNIKIYLLIAIQNILRQKLNFHIIDFPIDKKLMKNKNILKFDNHLDEYIVSPSKKNYSFLENLKDHITKFFIMENLTFEISKIFKITSNFEYRNENEKTYIRFISQKDCKAEIRLDENVYKSKILNNTYYNITLNQNNIVKVNSSKKIIFTPMIKSNFRKKDNSINLNLLIFVDGLLKHLVDDDEFFSKIMPHTYNFFKQGISFQNHYANGEWSLPSAGNFFSGCYTDKHKLFHNQEYQLLNKNLKLIGEYFSENNFQTYMINGSWRLAPTYGFCKGFDKTFYKREMSSSEAIDHFLSLDTCIKNEKKFYWLTLFDLHGTGFNHQIGDSFFMYNKLKKNNLKSVNLEYNDYLKDRYIFNCKLLDLKLNNLYNYINKTYQNDEVLVSLVTDHGQSFFDNENHVLRNNRIKIPWLIRGRNIVQKKVMHFSENVDLLPNFLKLNNISFKKDNFDGQVGEIFGGDYKQNIKSQSIFPNCAYKLRVDFKENKYFVESKNKMSEKCDLKNFEEKIQIFNLDNKEIDHKDVDQNELLKVKNIYNDSCAKLFKK